jgi:hypothetical protein
MEAAEVSLDTPLVMVALAYRAGRAAGVGDEPQG